MTQAQGEPKAPEPVERFHPTSGRFVGFASLAVIAGLLVYVAVKVHSLDGLRLGAGLLFFAVLVWATQIRPRATVYADTLHLQNSVRDVRVPLLLIEGVSVGRMLGVWAGERRYVCTGIGTPLRKMVKVKSRGPSSLLGWDRLEAYTEESTPHRPDQTAMSYQDFVETRLVDLVEEAQRRSAGVATDEGLRVEETWAWREIVALAVTAVLFVVSLLL